MGETPEYILETERLLLRSTLKSDLDRLHEIMSNDDAMTYWSCAPHTDTSKTMEFIEKTLATPPERPNLSICLKPTSPNEQPRFVGRIGVGPGGIGYILHPSTWRKGIASEAMKVFLEYFWSKSEVQVLKADVDPRNDASLGLLKKFGFVESGRAENTFETHLGWCDSIYLELQRPVVS